MKEWDFETKAIHTGVHPELHLGATSVPIYQTSSFAYDTAESMEDVFSNKSFGYIYSRISNPTVNALEERINALESGAGAVAAASGMAAISAVVFSLAESGDEIIASESLFGGTLLLFNSVLNRLGINTRYINPNTPDAIADKISKKTKLIFIETIGNPRLDVPDLKKIAGISTQYNIPLVIDGTLTTPYMLKAGDYGAAVVIHSATKFISGYGSGIGGLIVDTGKYDWAGSDSNVLREAAGKYGSKNAFLYILHKQIIQNTGSCLAPFNAFLQLQGLETLSLRMEKHCSNALKLAEFFKKQPEVASVNYPGLKSSKYFTIAEKQFKDKFGSLLTIRLGSKERCYRFVNRLKLVKNLANLGDAKTLIIHPASTIYHDCTEEEMLNAGVYQDMLRISVGIENIQDIISDFILALEGLAK